MNISEEDVAIDLLKNIDVKFYFSTENGCLLKFSKEIAYRFYDFCHIRQFKTIVTDLEKNGYKQGDHLFSRTHRIHPERSKVKAVIDLHICPEGILHEETFIQEMVKLTRSERIPLSVFEFTIYGLLKSNHYQMAKSYMAIIEQCSNEIGISATLKYEMIIASIIAKDEENFRRLVTLGATHHTDRLGNRLFALGHEYLKDFQSDIFEILDASIGRLNTHNIMYAVIIGLLLCSAQKDSPTRQEDKFVYFMRNANFDFKELTFSTNFNDNFINTLVLVANQPIFEVLIERGIDLHSVRTSTIKQLAKDPSQTRKLMAIIDLISAFDVSSDIPSNYFSNSATRFSGGQYSKVKFDKKYTWQRLYDYAAKNAAKYGNLAFLEAIFNKGNCPKLSRDMPEYCHNFAIDYGHGKIVKFFLSQGVPYNKNYFPKARVDFLLANADNFVDASDDQQALSTSSKPAL